MKKFFFAVFLLVFSLSAFSQEKKLAAGLGLEWNMDSRHNFAGGVLFNFDYSLPKNSAIGFTIEGSNNFYGISVIEPILFFRTYFPEFDHSGFFAQVNVGGFIILENNEVTVLPLMGCEGGYRKLLGSSFYIEPFGRLGYPFAWGIGLVAGMRF